MTRSVLIGLVDQYNNHLEELYYDSQVIDNLRDAITNLQSDWDTDHGQEIVAEMWEIFDTIETSLNEISSTILSMKNCKLEISFEQRTIVEDPVV